MSKVIAGSIGIILLLLIIIVSQYMQIDTLNSKVLELKSTPPQTITVHDNTVEYVYKDNAPVIINKPPEGKVQIDLDRYNSLYNELNVLREIVARRDTVATPTSESFSESAEISMGNDNDAIIPSLARTDSFNLDVELARIDEILRQLKDPLHSGLVTVKTRGVEFMPMIGVSYSGKLSPYIGAKILYTGYYGIVVGSSLDQVAVGISRYVYDIIPILKNTQVIVGGGFPYHKDGGYVNVSIGVGL